MRRFRRTSRWTHRAALVFAAFACAGPAPAAQWPERRFERVDGALLSSSHVTALAQDRDGFLWIGTEEGLDRFDGVSTRIFRRRPGDPGSLASNRISALLVARDGRLWIGTRGGGLARYDAERERFDRFRFDPADPESLAQDDVVALVEDRRGRIWIGTHRAGVDRAEIAADGSVRFVHHRHDPAEAASLGDDRVRALRVDRADRLWVGTLGGLHRLDGEAPVRFSRFARDPQRPDSLGDDEVWALAEDDAGTIWVGSWGGGVDRLDDPGGEPSTASFRHYRAAPEDPFSLADDRVHRLLVDGQGTLWVGQRAGGLAELPRAERDAERPRFRRHRHDADAIVSIAGDAIEALLEDAVGDLWIGGDGGLVRLDRRLARHDLLRTAPDDPTGLGAGPRAPFETADGELWIATADGLDRLRWGVDPYRPIEVSRLRAGAIPDDQLLALAEDPAGDIWLASQRSGLHRLAAARRAPGAERFVAVGAGELPTNAALALAVDPRGRLWVGTYRGLHRLRRDDAGEPAGFDLALRHDPQDPSTLSSDHVGELAIAPDGTVWAGCYYGLNRVDPDSGAVTRFVPDPARPGSLSYEFVSALAVGADGTVWVGTFGGGLDRLDPGAERFAVYGVADGLPSETVVDLALDRAGRLWIATPRGLARLDPATGAIERFGVADGLLETELHGLVATRDGRLVVVSESGIVRLAEPEPDDAPAPPVVLTGLLLRNEPVAIGAPGSPLRSAPARLDRLVLGPDDTTFALEFVAPEFRAPARLRYRYRLDGFDADWLTAALDAPRAAYSGVAPGDYRLLVAAASPRGAWSSPPAVLELTVLPPWWRTWWARGGGAAALALAAFAWHRVRLARLARRAAELEHRVEERTAELAAANVALERAARTDLLTGLPNRRHFLERAAAERQALRRSGRPYSLALADVDHFKRVNDSRGHECGDRVLAAVATTLRDAVRDRDLVARWGGEEFVLLFAETGLEGAATIAEKVRASVESLVVLDGDEPVPVTMTFGLAEATAGETIEAVAARADAALYAGKRAGRNQVALADAGEV